MEVKVYFIIHVSILWKFGLRLGWGLHPPRFWYNDHATMLNNIPPGTCVGIRIRPVLVIRSGYGATAVPRCLCNYMRWTSVRLENILRSWTLEGDAWDSVNVNVTDTKNATFTFHFIPCNALVKTWKRDRFLQNTKYTLVFAIIAWKLKKTCPPQIGFGLIRPDGAIYVVTIPQY